MEAELVIAEQIARLLQQRRAVVWELVEPPVRPSRHDVAIADQAGRAVAYTRPARA